ncbi:hypothetical protein MXB_5330 [Myxobolus squamalis]|nr:hypothetical protein MXB_5330 [Myxobolus squamalis]
MSRRFLNLQEYQCKNILSENSLVVQKFRVVTDSESAIKAAREIGKENFVIQDAKEYVIKAQILAGGRGKGVFSSGFKGGVHLTKDINEVPKIVSQMIGHQLITKQTPPEGVLVSKVTVCEALDIENETYVAVILDPGLGMPALIGSPCGGMDIEEVIYVKGVKEPIDIFTGPTKAQCLKMAKNLEFSTKYHNEVADQLQKLFGLAMKVDAVQVEINPFGVGSNNKVVCFDAKITFDDNAQYRQKAIFDLEDHSETPEIEMRAIKAGLTYIQMDGDIGCLVNGAGLAMATLDIVKLYGGSPSNFLDLGGTADEERVFTALNIFANDKRVRKIFINIFGGIVDCRIIADGIVNARNRITNIQPIVMRLQGNNYKLAKDVIEKLAEPSILMIDDFDDAARSVCATSPAK